MPNRKSSITPTVQSFPAGSILPHDLEAEKSVLGAVLLDEEGLVKVVEHLKPSHFYKTAHKTIFECMLNLYERREPIDLITLPQELKKQSSLENIGGVAYLTELVNSVPTASNAEFYAKIIVDSALRRDIISAGGKITQLAFETPDVEDLLDNSEQLLYSVSQDRLHQDFIPISDTLQITFERLDELSKTKGALRGVPMGLKTLDRMLSGLQRENLIILAARPSVGKSSIAINTAQYAATAHGKSIAIFSLEMGREQVVDRMISAQGDIDNWRITTGNLEPEDFERYGIAAGELAEAPIYIDDTPGIGILELRTKARRLQMDKKIDLIIVDYLQLIKGRSTENRVQEVSEISQALKNLARELKVPVLALSQLSRAVEQRGGDKRPQLSDLRDSGSIEQDADIVMFLYRPNEEDRVNHKLLIAKHRNGPTGEINLYFKADRTRFFESEAKKEDKS
jgi:replicative DNA helicase